jgi:hypothetical protein
VVRVSAEPLAGGDAVFVHHAQRAEAGVLRVVIFGERKSVPGIEPAVVGMSPVGGVADLDHDQFLRFGVRRTLKEARLLMQQPSVNVH